MAGNSFGQSFRITTAGESHGAGNIVIVDGVPAGLPLTEEDFFHDLARRRPGQSHIVTQREENDTPELLSGVFEGRTTGTPIALLIRNKDQRTKDYSEIKDLYRPGHADFGYDAKYGFRDYRGGGRASARETVARVSAGVIAKKLLSEVSGTLVVGWVSQVGSIVATIDAPERVREKQVETFADGSANIVRCPDERAAKKMIALIEQVRKDQDSIGGVAELCVSNVPLGLGEPVFDKLKADLAKALFSLPAVVGVEYGSGFAAATMRGSEHNDTFVAKRGKIATKTNRHGGMLGGLTTGMPIVMRAAVKPTSSLPRPQQTVNRRAEKATIRTKGRHDPCLLPRFIPMAEAMVALVLADHWLRQRSAAPLK